jgi:hypothetical protein
MIHPGGRADKTFRPDLLNNPATWTPGVEAGWVKTSAAPCPRRTGQVDTANGLGFGVNAGSADRLSQPPDPVRFDVERGQDPPDLRGADPHRLVQVLRDASVGPLRVDLRRHLGDGRHDP